MLLVLPKGRLLKEIKILLQDIGISFDESSRKLVMETSIKNLQDALSNLRHAFTKVEKGKNYF